MRTLKYGCVGNDVKWYQYRLNEEFEKASPRAYEKLEVDGHFGELTKERTLLYQSWKKLKEDGKVGPQMRGSLGLSDFAVWVLDPMKQKIWIAGAPYGAEVKPLKTLRQWQKEEKAKFVWNLALFNGADNGKKRDEYGVVKGRTLTYCRGKGYDIGYGGPPEVVVINYENACGGYRVAISGGAPQKVAITGKRARNAMGLLKDGKLFVVQSITQQTEAAIRDFMLANYDVRTMLLQDGGGSVGFLESGGTLIAAEREGTDGRAVATVLCAN